MGTQPGPQPLPSAVPYCCCCCCHLPGWETRWTYLETPNARSYCPAPAAPKSAPSEAVHPLFSAPGTLTCCKSSRITPFSGGGDRGVRQLLHRPPSAGTDSSRFSEDRAGVESRQSLGRCTPRSWIFQCAQVVPGASKPSLDFPVQRPRHWPTPERTP